MGIRYYAYAFESDETASAMADPLRIVRDDPLDGIWGDETGLHPRGVELQQLAPRREVLCLDKAWGCLQRLTGAPTSMVGHPRIAHRMFEGDALCTARGPVPWLRCIPPPEAVAIAEDLESISEIDVERAARRALGSDPTDGAQAYVLEHFRAAQDFVVKVGP